MVSPARVLSKYFWARRPLPWIHMGHSSIFSWCLELLLRRTDPLSKFFRPEGSYLRPQIPPFERQGPAKSRGIPRAYVFDPLDSPQNPFWPLVPVSSIDATFSESFWILGIPAFGQWSVLHMILGPRWPYLRALRSFLHPFVPPVRLSSIHSVPLFVLWPTWSSSARH